MGPMMMRVKWPQRFMRPCRDSEAVQAESAALSPSYSPNNSASKLNLLVPGMLSI